MVINVMEIGVGWKLLKEFGTCDCERVTDKRDQMRGIGWKLLEAFD